MCSYRMLTFFICIGKFVNWTRVVTTVLQLHVVFISLVIIFIYVFIYLFFRVNCSFYFKIGACRHGDRCSRLHNKPTFSQVRLLELLSFVHWERLSSFQNKFSSNSKLIVLYVCFFRQLPSWTFTGTLRIVLSLLMDWLVSIQRSLPNLLCLYFIHCPDVPLFHL